MSVDNSLPRILIVEDSRPLSVFYQSVIAKNFKVEVMQTYTGKEALTTLNEFPPDIVFLDLKLPDMTGMDILRVINQKHHDVITIVMTANGSVNYAVEAMRLGAYDFLEKPIDANRLCTTLKNAIEKLELNVYFTSINSNSKAVGDFIGKSPAMQEIYNKIRRIGNSKASVFITGESGTGKEVTALTLHNLNTERTGKFVAINCAAIPKELMESEIFGHVKGAFTGATSDRQGAVSQAHGGTLFLDELCEMDLDLQSKFLRFLQSSKFQKVGSSRVEEVDVRIICATNKNPMEEVKAGRFREDLFYRLFVIPIHLPPLRERDKDAVLIAQKFLERFAREEKKHFKYIAPDAQEFLLHYHWPGNVRQLQNVIQRAIVLYDDEVLSRIMLPKEDELNGYEELDLVKKPQNQEMQTTKAAPAAGFTHELSIDSLAAKGLFTPSKPNEIVPLSEIEKHYILAAIAVFEGSVVAAAKALDVNSSTLYRKLDKWQKDGSVIRKIGYEFSAKL